MERTPDQLFQLNNLAILRSPAPKRLGFNSPLEYGNVLPSARPVSVNQPGNATAANTASLSASTSASTSTLALTSTSKGSLPKPTVPVFSMRPPAVKKAFDISIHTPPPKILLNESRPSQPLQAPTASAAEQLPMASLPDLDALDFIQLDEWFVIPVSTGRSLEIVIAGTRSDLDGEMFRTDLIAERVKSNCLISRTGRGYCLGRVSNLTSFGGVLSDGFIAAWQAGVPAEWRTWLERENARLAARPIVLNRCIPEKSNEQWSRSSFSPSSLGKGTAVRKDNESPNGRTNQGNASHCHGTSTPSPLQNRKSLLTNGKSPLASSNTSTSALRLSQSQKHQVPSRAFSVASPRVYWDNHQVVSDEHQ